MPFSILIAILLCQSPSIAFINIWDVVLESVSMTALCSSCWNMKFVAIYIAFSSAHCHIFLDLVSSLKALGFTVHSYAFLLRSLSNRRYTPSAWVSSVRSPSARSDVVWCRRSFFSHFQCPLGRSGLPGFAPSVRESLYPPRPIRCLIFKAVFSIRLNFAVDVVSCVSSNFLIVIPRSVFSDTLLPTSFPVIHVLLCSGIGIVFAADRTCLCVVLEKPPTTITHAF
jgi:hypothetical protein